MNKTIAAPTTLSAAIKYFADPDISLAFLAGLRWPDGPVCPRCGVQGIVLLEHPPYLEVQRRGSGSSRVKLGTIFEDSPIGLDKWLPALWLLVNAKNGISSYELHRAIGVTQKTAWFMLHRIRLAMQAKSFVKRFEGDVEVDETFIGGRARFMHKDKKARVIKSTGPSGKAAVIGLLERHGPGSSRVRAGVIGTVRRKVLHGAIHATVAPGATIYTDDLDSYKKLDERFVHKVIDHAECYAKGAIHTNGLENFWSLLKRGLKGTYISVEPFHLFRYLDEQVFRFNNRRTKDVCRFIDALASIVGKRLTYDQLIGGNVAPATT